MNANATSAGTTSEIIDIQFEKYALPNGLEIILSEDHRLPIVAVNLWYHVGPANEKPGRTGFAHLFEHMMFQGSKHVGDAPIKTLETAGATQINGTTGFDRTNYFETLPSDKLEFALWFESDRMAFLLDSLTARNLANQRDVVRNERRQRENQPYSLVSEELFRQMFPAGHPYHASIIGSHADIESVSLNEVREFCRQFYVPNNATLALVGDFESAEAKRLIGKYFGPIPSGQRVPAVDVAVPELQTPKRILVTDTIQLPILMQAWHTPPCFQIGEAAFNLLAHILGDGRSSRLHQKLVSHRQMAQSVSVSNINMKLASIFEISVVANSGVEVETLEQSIETELNLLRGTLPTEDELAIARNKLQTALIIRLEQPGGASGVADRLNTYNHYLGHPGFVLADQARYDAVTPTDIRDAARKLIPERCLTVIGVPGEKVLFDVPKRTDKEVDVQPAVDLPGSEWRAVPPLTAARALPELPKPNEFRLDNGLQVFLVEQHHVPAITASFICAGGDLANPANRSGLSSFTAEMLLRGTHSRSQKQISEDIEKTGASLAAASNSDFSVLGFTVLRKNFQPAFEVMTDVLRHPAFHEEELEKLREERITAINRTRKDPAAVARHVLLAELYGSNHPYGYLSIGDESSIRSLTRDTVAGFYQSLYAPNNSALVLSGALTEPEALEIAEKYFGDWPGTTGKVQLAESAQNRQRRVVIVDRPGAPQTQLVVGQIGVERSYPEFAAVQVLNAIAGGMFSSRINTNLREVHGYTYGARSRFDCRLHPGPFTVSAAVRTDATAASVFEIFRELTKLQRNVVTSNELVIAKETLKRSILSRFQTVASTAETVAGLFVYGLPVNEYPSLQCAMDRVTETDVQRAANVIRRESMVVVAVGDAPKIEKDLRALNLGEVVVRSN